MKSFSGSCETEAYVFLISFFRRWTSMSTVLANSGSHRLGVVVAKSPIVTPTSSPPGFARSLATIAFDSSIPCAPLGERQRDPAGPDPELERASASGELDEEIHDRLDDLGREHVCRRLVVPRGDALVEVAVVGLHRRSLVSCVRRVRPFRPAAPSQRRATSIPSLSRNASS
jgi:hypothetical protein